MSLTSVNHNGILQNLKKSFGHTPKGLLHHSYQYTDIGASESMLYIRYKMILAPRVSHFKKWAKMQIYIIKGRANAPPHFSHVDSWVYKELFPQFPFTCIKKRGQEFALLTPFIFQCVKHCKMKNEIIKGRKNPSPETVSPQGVSWLHGSIFARLVKSVLNLFLPKARKTRFLNHKLKKTNADGSSVESDLTYWDKTE